MKSERGMTNNEGTKSVGAKGPSPFDLNKGTKIVGASEAKGPLKSRRRTTSDPSAPRILRLRPRDRRLRASRPALEGEPVNLARQRLPIFARCHWRSSTSCCACRG